MRMLGCRLAIDHAGQGRGEHPVHQGVRDPLPQAAPQPGAGDPPAPGQPDGGTQSGGGCANTQARVIAVGVESGDEWKMLRHLGVHAGQGPWFADPSPSTCLTSVPAGGDRRPCSCRPASPQATGVDEDDLAAARNAACRQFAKQPHIAFATVDGFQRQAGFCTECLHPLPECRTEPGIAAVVVIQRDAPARSSGRCRMQPAYLAGDEVGPLSTAMARICSCARLPAMSPARAPPAQGSTQRSGEKGTSSTSSATRDGQRAAALPVPAGCRHPRTGQAIRDPGAGDSPAGRQNEIHAPAFRRFQGGIADGIPFTAYDALVRSPSLSPAAARA